MPRKEVLMGMDTPGIQCFSYGAVGAMALFFRKKINVGSLFPAQSFLIFLI